MPDAPTGTVTLLFTDIEGSTQRWEREATAMASALARHDALLRDAIAANGGHVFKTVGDAFCAAFATAPAALAAALDAQQALAAEPWGEVGPLRVRMALHTGAADERDGDYFGQPVNRVARLLDAGHGGQILLSLATEQLTRDHLLDGIGLRDLGEHRLKDLARPERIFQLVVPGLGSDFPPLRTLDNRPQNLPAQVTPFIGREEELAQVRQRLERPEVRLVTLTGPGGTGKTRLALQIAADLIDDFADGVFFVPLATIRDPDLVVPEIAQTLGVRPVGGQPPLDGLREHLRDRQVLLVLDNVEQVVEAASAASELLYACPRLNVLVTSRITLRLSWEHEVPVPPLALPDRKRPPPVPELTRYDAVRLFVERAQAAKPDFAVTTDNAPAIVECCHRLDGLPLAIELAAARSKLLSPQAILARLESRLKLLTGGARDLPERQQTLRGAIAWSHELLPPEEQVLFRRLAIFAGGCTFEAAESICAADGNLDLDMLDGLASLVDKSLVRQVDQEDGEPRFIMLETIREYGLERLAESGEEPDIRRRHADWSLALAEEAEEALTGPAQGEWLRRLAMEHDNLRAALAWAVATDATATGQWLAWSLFRFWETQGHLGEGRRWLDQLLDQELPDAGRARLLIAAAVLARKQGDYAQAITLYEESLGLYRASDNTEGIASALTNLGIIAQEQGDYDQAMALHEEALAHFRELADPPRIAASLNNLGIVARRQGDHARARALYEEAMAIHRARGDRLRVALALNNLGVVAYNLGDLTGAVALYEEALTLWRELGDPWHTALSLSNLAEALRDLGDLAPAAGLFQESLVLRQEHGDRAGIAECLTGLASIAAADGRPAEAARRYGAAEALREAIGAPLPPAERAGYERSIAAMQAQLDETAVASAWAAGRALLLEQAVAEALDGYSGAPQTPQ